VDAAEQKEAAAEEVNAHGARRLADQCKRQGAVLLHFSTDYVFSGSATAPYPISAPRAPANAYGRGKALGEEMIERSGCEYLIVRTSWLYAPWGKNFVRTIAALGRDRDQLKVVHDQRGRPTSSESLARRSIDLVERTAGPLWEGRAASGAGPLESAAIRSIWHLTDGGECTWWDLASFIVTTIGAKARVEPCTSAEFPRPAKRPAYSVLDLSESDALLGPAPPWRDEVGGVLSRLER
jgi:dTDP-4-dehydrorhamnose reductase